jgi:predicted HicB family RNase H-like nuclease
MKSPAPATKANIKPRQQSGAMKYLGSLTEEPVKPADNMKKKDAVLRDLNFKVDPDFHTRFKMTATAAGLSMKELLEQCFDAWTTLRRG